MGEKNHYSEKETKCLKRARAESINLQKYSLKSRLEMLCTSLTIR